MPLGLLAELRSWQRAVLTVALVMCMLIALTFPSAQQPPAHGSIILHKLTGPDKQVIFINPQQIVALRAPRRAGDFGEGVQCIINTADGKFLSVIETCDSFVVGVEPGK